MNKFLIPPFEFKTQPDMAFLDNVLSHNEINKVIIDGSKLPATEPLTRQDMEYRTEDRKCSVHWIPIEDEWLWLYEKISAAAQRINSDHYQFDLRDLYMLHLAHYDKGGHYNFWHKDSGQSKLTCTLQLSSPECYDGGELQIFTGGEQNQYTMPKDPGTLIGFPAWTPHRVTTITKGERYSVVCWFGGPPFN